MPPFPEKEVGGLLNLLKKKRPGRVPEGPEPKSGDENATTNNNKANNSVTLEHNVSGGGSADLLGLGIGESAPPASATNGVNGFDGPTNNIAK